MYYTCVNDIQLIIIYNNFYFCISDILGSSNFGQATQQPQLSPNRNVQLASSGNGSVIGGGSGSGGPPQRASIFGRVYPERRTMPSGLGGGPMVSVLYIIF